MVRRNRDAGLPGHPTKFAPNVRDASGCPLVTHHTLTPTDRRYRSVLVAADAPLHESLKSGLVVASIEASENSSLDDRAGRTATILHRNRLSGSLEVIEGTLGNSLGRHRLTPKGERGRAIALDADDCLVVLDGYGRSDELVETYEKYESQLPELTDVEPDVWDYVPTWDGEWDEPMASAAFVLAGRRKPSIFIATDMSVEVEDRGHVVYGYEFTPGSSPVKTMIFSSDLEKGSQAHILEPDVSTQTLDNLPSDPDAAYQVLFGSSPHID